MFSSDTTGKFDLLDRTSGSFNERLLLLAVALKSINQSLYSLSLCISAGAYELPCAYGAQQTTLGVSPHLQPCLRIFCLLFGEPASYLSINVQALFFISELISSYIYGKYFIHGAISPALCYVLLKLNFLCVLFYCVCVVCVCVHVGMYGREPIQVPAEATGIGSGAVVTNVVSCLTWVL